MSYLVIPRKMEKVDGVYVNTTELPQDKEFDGQFAGIGFKNLHNLYKGAWNPKRGVMTWSFSRLVDNSEQVLKTPEINRQLNIEYEIIPIKMVKVGSNYVNKTELPETEDYDGVYIGVGHKKIHNIYKGSWNNRHGKLSWSYLMTAQ